METAVKSNPLVAYAEADLASGRFGRVLTRFAPKPNAYIHLGSATRCAMTFGLAEELGGEYNLRFDDTNPETASLEYVESIKEDLRWLGYERTSECYASDYFDQLYEWAKMLISSGDAYVCDLSEGEVRDFRGTNSFDSSGRRVTPPGVESPYRERSSDECLDLFERMKNGQFSDGSHILRAKINMRHDNLLMRDPVMYRIKRAPHYRTGDSWSIYPTYDWAHGQSDSIEGITHSVCGLEFRSHRLLYDWSLDRLEIHHPRQMEYTRINLTHTITAKRYLKRLVAEGIVAGWDDPRLPTLSALRRRGFPAQAVPRFMAVLRPLKVVIVNYPEEAEEILPAVNNPEDPSAGTRGLPFGRELYVERDDFMEHPPKKFYRLSPGREVRLRYAFFITCDRTVKDTDGTITELHCRFDPETRGGGAPDGRKAKATLHWVSARHAVRAEVRLYDRLFDSPEPLKAEGDGDWMESVRRDSIQVLSDCYVEPELALRDTWRKIQDASRS